MIPRSSAPSLPVVVGALVAAVAAAVVARLAVLQVVGRELYLSSVPDALAALAAGAAGCMVVAWAQRRRAGPARWAWGAVACAGGFLWVAGLLTWDPRACRSDHLPEWVGLFCAVAALIWGVGWAIERRQGQRLPVVTALLAAMALAAMTMSTGDRLAQVLQGDRTRVWNVYHYYLGSKYFGEFGYDQLYAATLAADDLVAPALGAGEDDLQFVRVTRDMESYRPINRRRAIQRMDPSIDRDTLVALHADLRPLLPHASETTWKQILSDLGYNPAPAWPVVGKPLARLLPTEGPGYVVLTNLDLPLFAAMLLASLWAWGPRVTSVMVIYIALVGFNKVRLVGGFLQYDWLASLVVGVALWRRGWAATGGAVLSWGAMTRVFPGFFVFPALAALAWRVVRRRPLGLHTPAMRFLLAFTMACSVWFALSHTTGRGLQTWPEWVQAIRHHSTLHGIDGRARLGLTRLGAHQPTADNPWNARERTIEPEAARELLAKVRPWKVIGALCVVALATRRRDPMEKALWMLALVWVGVVTSRYYGSSWALLATLGLPPPDDDDGPQRAPGVWAGAMLLLLPGVFYAGGDDNDAIYLPVNYWFGLTLLGIAALWTVEELRQRGAPTTRPNESSSE